MIGMQVEHSDSYLFPYVAAPGLYRLSSHQQQDEDGQFFDRQIECHHLDTIQKIGKLENGFYVHYETGLEDVE